MRIYDCVSYYNVVIVAPTYMGTPSYGSSLVGHLTILVNIEYSGLYCHPWMGVGHSSYNN